MVAAECIPEALPEEECVLPLLLAVELGLQGHPLVAARVQAAEAVRPQLARVQAAEAVRPQLARAQAAYTLAAESIRLAAVRVQAAYAPAAEFVRLAAVRVQAAYVQAAESILQAVDASHPRHPQGITQAGMVARRRVAR